MECPTVTFACQECGKPITFPAQRRGHVEDCPECGCYVDVPYETELLPLSETAAPETGLGSGRLPIGRGSGSRTTAQLWFEVFAVLCLAYVPYLFYAIAAINRGRPISRSPLEFWLYLLVDSVQISAPLLVIMALSKDPWSLFGIVRPAWLLDALGTCVIWIAGYTVYHIVMFLLPTWILEASHSVYVAHRSRPAGTAGYLFVIVVFAASGFSEELVMRGYLIPRLERLLRSTWIAVLVTSVLFGSYHLYQGIAPAIACSVLGVFFGVSFCMTRRLWPFCVAHALYNFLHYV